MAVDENTGNIIEPKCPKCGESIEYLDYECQEYDWGYYGGDGDWTCKGPDGIVPHTLIFTCPQCGAEVANTTDEADAILKYIE